MDTTTLFNLNIVLIDDEPANVLLLRRVLEQIGFSHITGFTNPIEGWAYVDQNGADLLLLDLQMPIMDGFEILEKLQARGATHNFIPVMVLTADATPNAKRQALSLGANDFLTKPFEAFEVGLRVKNLLRMRSLYTNLSDEKSTLEEKVEERTEAIKKTQLEIVERLGLATEFRDDDTKEHVTRVGELAGKIAAILGLPPEFISTIRYSALLHDVGKIGISDTILLKPGKLTEEEYETMKQHTKIGAQILGGSKSEILAMAEEIAITHHERWDGRGYPNQLKGQEIPLSGRIVAVVDVFDALTNERSYKKAWPIQDALSEIERNSGSQFDPMVVDALLQLFPWFQKRDDIKRAA